MRALCEASPYLAPTTRKSAVDLLWSLLIGHGERYLHDIVRAAAAHSALRALRPWVSHGSLHLVYPDYVVDSERRGFGAPTLW